MDQHYTAFISYRHVSPDQELAKWLHTAIETYRIPAAIRRRSERKSMGKCFRDQEELPLSPSLGDDIERALLNSDWFIAVCTPRYPQSPWCLRELEFFARHKGRDRILVVLADGHAAESLPELLKWRVDEAGRRVPYEPLAAEARGATMGERIRKLRTEKFRVLAPMLGVGFDDLRRRARQRRIRTASGIAAAVILAGAGLGAYTAANHAKNERLRLEAEEQEHEAEEQRRVARAERQSAVQNSIGEALERAASLRASGERIGAARLLMETLELSESSKGLRRAEILDALRQTLYIEPFTPIAGFSNQNVRLLDIVPAPGGRLAVGVENNNSVALIDLEANELRYKVSCDNSQLGDAQFSPDGSRFLAVCDMGRLVTVWNTADGSVAFTYTSRADERYHIANAFFWQDADTLLVQDMDRFLLVSADGTEEPLYTLGQQQDWYDPANNIYTIAFGKSPDQLLTVHHDDYTGTPVAATPDRTRLLVAGLGGETGTLILDGEGRLVTPLYGMPGTFAEKYAISDDGRTAACLSLLGFYAGWDADSGELLYFQALDTANGAFSAPVFSPDGRTLSFVANETLYIADARTGEVTVMGNLIPSSITPKLSCSADGDYLFVTEQSLYIVDARGRLFLLDEAGDENPYTNAVQLGDRVLLTRADGSALVCCVPAASSMRSVPPEAVPALCEAYDPHTPPADSGLDSLRGEHALTDAFRMTTALTELSPGLWYAAEGDRAALSYADGVIELFDERDGGAVSAMIGQLTREITALGMKNDRLVASDGGGRLLLYDLKQNSVIEILNAEVSYTAFAFSGGGDRLMALRADGAIDVYDLEKAERLFTMRSAEPFTGFGFAADGSCALGLTAAGALRAELWTDEQALLVYAEEFIY